MSNIQPAAQTVLNICINLLAKYPKTEHEVSKKIEEYLARSDFADLAPDELDLVKIEVLSRLKTSGLLNDAEYLDSFIRGNNNSLKPDGSLLVYKKMRQKGISSALLSAKSLELAEFDKQNAIKLLQKKFGVSSILQSLPAGQRQKMISYLVSRGFKYSTFSSSEESV